MLTPISTLGKLSFEVTQDGVDEVLTLLDPKNEVSMSALDVGTNVLGYLKMVGKITLRNFRLAISDSKGTGSAELSPSFTIEYISRTGHSRKAPIEVTFQPPQIGVNLRHEGSKAYLVFYVIQSSSSVSRPGWVPQPIWNLTAGELRKFSDLVKSALNAQLDRHPIELFDLKDISEIKLAQGKVLDTSMHFEALEFNDSNLKSTVRVQAR